MAARATSAGAGGGGGRVGLAVLTGAILAVAAAGGCQKSVGQHGRERDIEATYALRTLEAQLGPEIQVLTVSAAAEQALRARGYTVTRTRGGGDHARIEARAGGEGSFDKVVIETWQGAGFTGVSVTREPWGDEAVSRALLDGVLRRLGK